MRWLGALVLAVLGCNSVEEGPVDRPPGAETPADGRTVEPEADLPATPGGAGANVELTSAPADLLFLIDRSATWSAPK